MFSVLSVVCEPISPIDVIYGWLLSVVCRNHLIVEMIVRSLWLNVSFNVRCFHVNCGALSFSLIYINGLRLLSAQAFAFFTQQFHCRQSSGFSRENSLLSSSQLLIDCLKVCNVDDRGTEVNFGKIQITDNELALHQKGRNSIYWSLRYSFCSFDH